MGNNLVDSINILNQYSSESDHNQTTSGNYAGGRNIQYPSTVVTATGYVVELIELLSTKLSAGSTDNFVITSADSSVS
ncbi:MAG TPA: hypothetical protein VL989_03100 [Candidatus Sulfotelmatobacter sp.]|nr:hypothetical protein [Candidatus Sulfotelmatobacter sp.]